MAASAARQTPVVKSACALPTGTVVGLAAPGHSFDEIPAAYRYLEKEDIRAALAYAAWRVEELELPLPAA